MHHGKFTTAREAVAAHNGEALTQRKAFDALPREPTGRRDRVLEVAAGFAARRKVAGN